MSCAWTVTLPGRQLRTHCVTEAQATVCLSVICQALTPKRLKLWLPNWRIPWPWGTVMISEYKRSWLQNTYSFFGGESRILWRRAEQLVRATKARALKTENLETGFLLQDSEPPPISSQSSVRSELAFLLVVTPALPCCTALLQVDFLTAVLAIKTGGAMLPSHI